MIKLLSELSGLVKSMFQHPYVYVCKDCNFKTDLIHEALIHSKAANHRTCHCYFGPGLVRRVWRKADGKIIYQIKS